ncbi:MAG: protein-L-isoaspartate O-methyltransferase [Paracoccaceae bacterium]
MTDYAAARAAMVDCQIRPSDVTRYGLIAAMLKIPRERFVPRGRRAVAYAGLEIEIAPGRALLEPRILAKMIDAAAIGDKDLVLDLAPGTGYSSAVMAELAEAVVAIEPDEALARAAQQTIVELDIHNAAVSAGDPAVGDAPHGPYDVIFVNGMVGRIPDALYAQLRDGGRLVAIFAEGSVGKCRLVVKSGGGFSERYLFDAGGPALEGFEKLASFEF